LQLLDMPPQPFLAGDRQGGGLRILAGQEMLTEYLFNTKKNQHFFCKVCGVRPFGVGNETPMGTMYGVNIGCLEGITEAELSTIPITYVDGMNNRWSDAPEFFRSFVRGKRMTLPRAALVAAAILGAATSAWAQEKQRASFVLPPGNSKYTQQHLLDVGDTRSTS
jgi:hypothetical protein